MVQPERLAKGLWWDKALTLVSGCTPVSDGCANCWAAREAHMRGKQSNPKMQALYGGLTGPDGKWNGRVCCNEDRVRLPLAVKKPTVWAVWNDLFHPDVPADFITYAYAMMAACPWHRFVVLTKRPERLYPVLYGEDGDNHFGGGDWLQNVLHMTTAENQAQADVRIPALLAFAHRSGAPWPLGVSVEPCLGEVDLTPWLRCGSARTDGPVDYNTQGVELYGLRLTPHLGWSVLGAETGPGARPMHPDWARKVRNDCEVAGVPFMFKGWGEWLPAGQRGNGYGPMPNVPIHDFGNALTARVGRKAAGRLLDGREHLALPAVFASAPSKGGGNNGR